MIRSLFLAPLAAALLAGTPVSAQTPDYRARLPEDEIIYFVLPDRFENGDPANDRGGYKGDRLKTGYDPTAKGFYHGGDLKGLLARLDYIRGLGATAIWVGPIFRNKPVQGPAGQESAGYHGYWINDFTHVDPHFGSDADFRALVDAAHARGIKVYMDIIANHTADVIQYRECVGKADCPYRSRADFPYQRRARDGAAINPGFVGDEDRSEANFARLTDPSFAYTPFVPKAEARAKTPAWLNDPIFYHNRGESLFCGESSQMGDFVGLDDLNTQHPRVVAGMIAIYGDWIDRFGIDGFRIDTARHVEPAFWRAFVPAMLARARAKGMPNFHIFGEVFDPTMQPGILAKHTRDDGYPAVLDFAFKEAVVRSVAGNAPTEIWRELLAEDVLYEGGAAAARQLPTFVGNHDQGRFAFFVRQANPQAGDAEILARTMLGHVLLLTVRGAPTLYYGDEQGFAGDGGDQDAREDMFASRVASYNDNRLVGSTATTAVANFDPQAPLYRTIAKLAAIRRATPALRRGETVFRAGSDGPGLLAFSRRIAGSGEVLVVINTASAPLTANVEVDVASARWTVLAGDCPVASHAPGSAAFALPPFGFAICQAVPPASQP